MSVNTTDLLVRRRTGVVAPVINAGIVTPETFKVVSDAENKLESLGYTLAGDALVSFLQTPTSVASATLAELLLSVSRLVGAVDASGNPAPVAPMYPNFPRQVEEASDSELYLNAILHYIGDWIGVRIMPEYEKLDRGETNRTRPLREITLIASEKDAVADILRGLIAQKAVWSAIDREDVAFLVASGVSIASVSFASRANLAYFIADMKDVSLLSQAASLTDVLRIAIAVAGGNPEFVAPKIGGEKLGSISRPFRRAIVARMNELITIAETIEVALNKADARRRLGLWKLVGKLLHVGEYQSIAPLTVEFFDAIRKGEIPVSSRGLIQTGTVTGVERDVLRAQAPGEFARDLDWALRTSDDSARTLAEFQRVAASASTRTLWGAEFALSNRDASIRAFLPKGNANRVQFSKQALPNLDASIIADARAVVEKALETQYAQNSLVPKGAKVWIDPVLDAYAVPFAVRNQGLATRPLGRGSRIKIADSEFIRFFMWWKDIDGKNGGYSNRVDLDMSMSFLNEDFEVVSEVAFYNLRNGVGVHSGDITSAPNGAAEYIDIRHSALAEHNGARYVAMSVLSFTGQSFKNIPEAIAGVMLRENLDKGEIFDAKTMETAFSVTQDTTGVVPFVYDIVNRELIWLDFAVARGGSRYNTAAGQRSKFGQIVEATATRKPVTVGELVSTHVSARGGVIVRDAKDADVVYGPEVAFEAEKLLAEWL